MRPKKLRLTGIVGRWIVGDRNKARHTGVNNNYFVDYCKDELILGTRYLVLSVNGFDITGAHQIHCYLTLIKITDQFGTKLEHTRVGWKLICEVDWFGRPAGIESLPVMAGWDYNSRAIDLELLPG